MGKKYGANTRLLFSDTDSFLYWIRTRDLYSDLASDSDRFDFSNYPREHPLYSAKGAKQPGLFKDESAGCILESFVGLRSKMYSLQHSDSGKDARKAKGIKKSVVRTISPPRLSRLPIEHETNETFLPRHQKSPPSPVHHQADQALSVILR